MKRSSLTLVAAIATGLALASPGTAGADWSSPVGIPIASPSTPVPLSLRAAVAPDGAMVVVWCEDDSFGNAVVQTARIGADGTVGTVHPLSTSADVPRDIEVRVGPDGAATVVWRGEDEESDGVVRTTRIAADGTPGTEIYDLSDDDTNANAPDFALDPTGAATVVWQQTTGGDDPAIQSVEIDSAGTPGAAHEISDDGEGEGAFAPRVATAPDGATTVLWKSVDGPDSSGLQAVQIVNGTVGPILDPVEGVEDSIYPPALAIGTDGVATAVWQQADGDEVTIETVRIASNGVAGTVEDVGEPHYLAAAALGDYPTVVVGPDGVATTVWTRSDLDAPYVVQMARIPPSGVPGAAQDLSPSSVRSALDADAAIGPSGDVTVIWHGSHPEGDNSAIEAVRIAANGTIGAVDTLAFSESPEGIPDLSSPAIAANLPGAVGAVWESSTEIRASRFEAAGPDPGDPPGPPPSPPPPVPPSQPAPKPTPPVTPRRASFALLAQPKRLTVKRGARARLALTVRNAGGVTARRTRICVKAPRRAFLVGRCLEVGQLAAGKRVRRSVTVRLKSALPSGRTYVLKLTVSGIGATSKAAAVRIKTR